MPDSDIPTTNRRSVGVTATTKGGKPTATPRKSKSTRSTRSTESVAPITVIGITGDNFDGFDADSLEALHKAKVVAGGNRHLEIWSSWAAKQVAGQGGVQGGGRTAARTGTRTGGRTTAKTKPVPQTTTIAIAGDVDGVARQIAAGAAAGATTVVLASGDPGFFGILRALLRVADRRDIRVIPAPSSVSLAFARLGLPWDDAVVVSAHGRSLDDAVRIVRVTRKTAILTSPDNPPKALGRALIDAGAKIDFAAVCSRLGCEDESVTEVKLERLARGNWDPLSVVVLLGPQGLPVVGWGAGKPLAWGLPDSAFEHRSGMVTKAELRAIVLGKLALPPAGVLWDIGAGSGSVGIECARLCPGMTVFAIERRPEDVERVMANASAHGVAIHVIEGDAPGSLEELPPPDRIFVGGGGIEVLRDAIKRLRPGGRVVATYAALDRAAEAAECLGSVAQVGLSRGERLSNGSWRLAAENPVFVAWGPDDSIDDIVGATISSSDDSADTKAEDTDSSQVGIGESPI